MIFYNTFEVSKYLINSSDKLIGITSGCFDLIHPLHVEYLNKCRKECDILFVFVDSDKLVYENKAKSPLINELDTAYMIDNLQSVSSSSAAATVNF